MIKRAQYEISQKRLYKKLFWLPVIMLYDSKKDEYTCAKGRKLVFEAVLKKKHPSGYVSESYVYRCTNCQRCGLRVNRSIQLERAFGQIKRDYSYKRILRRGKKVFYKELLFLTLGFSIRKLHNRMQDERINQRFLRKADKEEAC